MTKFIYNLFFYINQSNFLCQSLNHRYKSISWGLGTPLCWWFFFRPFPWSISPTLDLAIRTYRPIRLDVWWSTPSCPTTHWSTSPNLIPLSEVIPSLNQTLEPRNKCVRICPMVAIVLVSCFISSYLPSVQSPPHLSFSCFESLQHSSS